MQIKPILSKISREGCLRIAILAAIAVLLACGLNGRWTVKDWATPIEYGVDGPASDVKSLFAGIKAASEGHFFPFLSKRNPQLGAPYIANWDDYPCTEQFHVFIAGILAKAIGVFAAVNLLAVMSHVLAVLGFYAACRALNYRWEWSSVGALLFGFASYIFARSEHHLTVAYVAHVPLVILVFRWAIAGGEGPAPAVAPAPASAVKRGGKEPAAAASRQAELGKSAGEAVLNPPGLLDDTRFYLALAVAVFTGLNHVYYTNMLVQLAGIAFLYHAFQRRWACAGRAAAVAATGLGAFLAINLNTFWASHMHGPNPVAVSRVFQWLEFSGFKLADMFIAPPSYWIPGLARWGERYFAEVVLKGEVPYGSYIGLAGIAAFVWLVVEAIRNVGQTAFKRPPWEALVIAWVVIYSTVGGLNCWVGSLGFILFRSSTRYTIYILALVLMFAVRRLSTVSAKWSAETRLAIAAGILLVGLWDQVPRGTNENQDAIAQAVASDRSFTEQMEARLQPNSMVFQVPIMNFPESPAAGVTPYDHFRPFIYSKALRFSFGDVKGRPQSGWQGELGLLSPAALMDKVESYGFGALYLNLAGFADRGKTYLDAAATRGAAVIQSPSGDLACVFLKPSASPMLPPTPPYFGNGWYELENDGTRQQRLCRDSGTLVLTNPGSVPVDRYLTCILGGMDNRIVRIASGDTIIEESVVKAGQGVRVHKKVTLRPGENVFTFSTDRTSIPTMRGPVSFVMVNFQMTDSPVATN